MVRNTRVKQERIVEAVRRGLEGETAVAFLHQAGFAMTTAGIARHLRTMGGRGRLVEWIKAGMSNTTILARCFPEDAKDGIVTEAPSQGDLFGEEEASGPAAPLPFPKEDLFDTTKITLRIPTELHTALRLAARGEGTTQTQLIIDLLTSALSRIPNLPHDKADGDEDG